MTPEDKTKSTAERIRILREQYGDGYPEVKEHDRLHGKTIGKGKVTVSPAKPVEKIEDKK